MPTDPDRGWSLSASAFESLLARLASDPDTAAREYDAIRRKLVGFFERRNASMPEMLADETIDRVAHRLDEGEVVQSLRAYFFGVAKHILCESVRQRSRQESAERQLVAHPAPFDAPDAAEQELASVACLERCLEQLPPESRQLIVRYHQCGRAERQRLAAELGMTYTCLKSQAHRIRLRLGTCVQRCLGQQRAIRRGRSAYGPRG
jgi:RNA polymerase sigma factor (sigma-70 family)